MKLLSSIAIVSSTSIMAVFSLGANAETLSNLQNRSDSHSGAKIAINKEAAIQNDSIDPPQLSHIAPNNTQNIEKASGYSVFSLAKDRQITLDNLEQDLATEDMEWYIEKFDHIDL